MLAAVGCSAICGLILVIASGSVGAMQLIPPPFVVTWGWGVEDGTSAFQRCRSGCQAGIAGSAVGQFDNPFGIATDEQDNVYVVDNANARIQVFTSDGTFLSQWAAGFATGIAVDTIGSVYVTFLGSNNVSKFTANGDLLNNWGSSGSAEGQFFAPRRVAVDPTGNVYVTDQQNHRVQVFDGAGTFVRMWGWGVQDGSPMLQVCTSGCQAGIAGSGDGQFNGAFGVAVDRSGNVYVTDGNDRVQVFTTSGSFVGKWGSSGSADGQFDGIDAVAVDPAGRVYVGDSSNHRIQVFDAAGTFLGKWGSSGTAEGQFDLPRDLAIGQKGRRFYVADQLNERVQLFALPLSFFRADALRDQPPGRSLTARDRATSHW